MAVYEDVKASQLYQNANGYIRYADSTYNNSGNISSSSANALAIFTVTPGETYRVGLHMLTRFRVGTLDALVSNAIVQNLWIADGDTNGTTVIDEDRTYEITIPDGMNYLLVGYWSGTDGEWQSTWDSLTLELLVSTATLTDLTLTSPPTKLEYLVGEQLDTTGMVLTATYDDGTQDTVSRHTVSGYDAEATGVQTITVTVQEQTVTFTVTVRYPVFSELLNTTGGMTVIRNNSQNDDGTDTVTGVDWFRFNGVTASTIYVSGNNWIGFGTSTEQLKICRRDGAIYYLYRQEGRLDNGKRFLKLRVDGTTVYNSYITEYRLVYEVILFDDESIFINVIQTPTDSGYLGTSELMCGSDKTALSIAAGSTAQFSCYAGTDDGTMWAVEAGLPRALIAIAVTTPPNKILYYAGDALDTTGMVVTATYEDDTVKDITAVTVLGYEAMTLGIQTLSVVYRGYTATFTVTVENAVIGLTLLSQPHKTEYRNDDLFDPTGMVVAFLYADGNTEITEEYTIPVWPPLHDGAQNILIEANGFTTTVAIVYHRICNFYDLLDTTDLMELVCDKTYIGQPFAVTGVDWFWFNEITASVIYISRNNNIGFGINSSQFNVISSRYTVVDHIYRQEGTLTNGLRFLKLRISGMVLPGNSATTGPRFTDEVFLFDDNTIFLNFIQAVSYYPVSPESSLICGSVTMQLDINKSYAGQCSCYAATAAGTDWAVECTKRPKFCVTDITVVPPTKLEYAVGELLDTTNMTVTAAYGDNTKSAVNAYTLSGYDANVVGTQIVTVCYANHNKTFEVVVTNAVDRIELLSPPTKTDYKYGDSFDSTGTSIRVYYVDGTYDDISDVSKMTFSGYSSTTAGAQTILITYRNASTTATVTLVVQETGIRIVSPPTKTVYAEGDVQDYTGLAIEVCYADGSAAPLTDGYTVSDIDFTIAGNQNITVKYSSFSATFQIQGDFAVSLKSLLNKRDNMTLLFDMTTIASTNVIEGVDWFQFNGVTASTIYLSQIGWLGFGVSEAQFKIRYQGPGVRYVYRQSGHLTNGHRFLKLRIHHYTGSTSSNSTGYYFNYELYLFDDNSMFFYPVYYPTVSSYAGTYELTCGEEILTFQLYPFSPADHLNDDYSFYSFGTGGTNWRMSNSLHKYSILGIKIRPGFNIKTTYEIGEQLDVDSVHIYREHDGAPSYYDDYVLLSDCTISGFDSTKIGTQTIVISYTDPVSAEVYTTSYEVRVIAGTYTVKFLSHNGNTLKSQSVEYGNSATAPEPPDVIGYRFLTWSTSFGYITSNLTVSAIYRPLDAAFATVVYDAAHNELGRIYRAVNASVTRKLSGECTFEITTAVNAVDFIHIDHRLEVDGLIFNITEIKKQTQNGAYFTTIQGEHVSYILNDDQYKMTDLDYTGSPSGCLARLLSGTPFHVGTIDFTQDIRLQINKECTRRSAVMQLVALCGGEIDYDGYNINIVRHVGKTDVIELMPTENVTDLAVSTSADGTVTYDVTLFRRMMIELGSELHILFKPFSIDERNRIVGLTWNPYNFRSISVTVGTYQATLMDLYEVKESIVSDSGSSDAGGGDSDGDGSSGGGGSGGTYTGFDVVSCTELPENPSNNTIYLIQGTVVTS